MNTYEEMTRKHQEEVNALPLGFAFSNKQFVEMMRGWGLHPERDVDKIYRLPGGGFIQKKDSPRMHELLRKHKNEFADAIAADLSGDGFIYEMFLTELADHEYGYTRCYEDTLEALGFTWEQVTGDDRLLHGLEKASKQFRA